MKILELVFLCCAISVLIVGCTKRDKKTGLRRVSSSKQVAKDAAIGAGISVGVAAVPVVVVASIAATKFYALFL